MMWEELLSNLWMAPNIFLLVLSVLVWRFRCWKRQDEVTKPFDGLPMPPDRHWFQGHACMLGKKKSFQEGFHSLMEKYANEYGQTGFCKYGVGHLLIELFSFRSFSHSVGH